MIKTQQVNRYNKIIIEDITKIQQYISIYSPTPLQYGAVKAFDVVLQQSEIECYKRQRNIAITILIKALKANGEGDNAMSTSHVYEIKITEKLKTKPEPTISKEKMVEYKANVEKYLGKRHLI